MESRSNSVTRPFSVSGTPGTRRSHGWRRLLVSTFYGLCTLATSLPSPVFAETPTIQHDTPDRTKIPSVGTPMTIKVVLRGTREFEQPLRVIAIRDANLMDIWIPQAELSTNEVPVYSFELHAPERRIHYRFFLYQKDGSVISSQDYFLERSCTYPTTTVAPEDVIPRQSQSDAQESARLFTVSRSLERELSAFEEAGKLLEQVKTLIPNQEGGVR